MKPRPSFPMRPIPPAPAKAAQSNRRRVRATHVIPPAKTHTGSQPQQPITQPTRPEPPKSRLKKPPPSRQSALSPPPASKRTRLPRSASKSVSTASSIPHGVVPKPLRRNTVSTKDLRKDRLGTLVQNLATSFDESSSWEAFVTGFRGRSYLAPHVEQVQHPAAKLLAKWRDEGVPAMTSSEPWPVEDLDMRIERGCHHSAVEHSEFLREEMAEFIENGFWVVLPYSQVRHLPNLQLSPAAVKEERDRKPRLLCDHSWYPVNDTTLPHCPPEAMQFGGALGRIMHRIRHAHPRYGPVYLSKHDIKDGFYRMFLRATDCPRLAIVLPKYDGEEQMVGIPMSCTMGWTQSPPTFSAMSETVADVANAVFAASPRCASEHRLAPLAESMDELEAISPVDRGVEDHVATALLAKMDKAVTPEQADDVPAFPVSNRPLQRPIGYTDVFVDDFIQLGQGGKLRLNVLRNHLLHSIDAVLARPQLDEPLRNEAVSLKKLLKGDGSWATRKLVLGWILDSVRKTIELPAHRKAAVAEIFADLAKTKRVGAKKWSSILGKLRFISMAIPGSAGLFSALQWAKNQAGNGRVRIDGFVRDSIDAFGRLAASLIARPTYLAELVPEDPAVLGATDAAKPGMGGVFFNASGECFVWRLPFPADVQANLVSSDNLTGDITNSDLEQAGVLAQRALMVSHGGVPYSTLETFCDNTPAVSRDRKGAVSGPGAASALCRFASDHQRQHRYCHVATYLPGPKNVMGDDASRMQELSDTSFLAYFEQRYPQPSPWQLLHLPAETASALISCLRSPRRAKTLSRRPVTPATVTGTPGANSAKSTASSLTSVMSLAKKTRSATSLSTASDIGPLDAPVNLSRLVQWRTPSWQWARGSPTWVSQISEKQSEEGKPTIPYSLLSSRPCVTKTTRRSGPTRSTSPSSGRSTKPWTAITRSKGKPTEPPLISSLSVSSGS